MYRPLQHRTPASIAPRENAHHCPYSQVMHNRYFTAAKARQRVLHAGSKVRLPGAYALNLSPCAESRNTPREARTRDLGGTTERAAYEPLDQDLSARTHRVGITRHLRLSLVEELYDALSKLGEKIHTMQPVGWRGSKTAREMGEGGGGYSLEGSLQIDRANKAYKRGSFETGV